MANYVSNVLHVDREFKDILATLTVEGTDLVDFNKVLPIPEGIDDEIGWMAKHWGTNGTGQLMQVRPRKHTINFWTKWSAPLGVIEELSRQFPNVTFNLIYADEDYGNNLGQLEYKNGVQTDWYYPNTESEIKEMFNTCWKSK